MGPTNCRARRFSGCVFTLESLEIITNANDYARFVGNNHTSASGVNLGGVLQPPVCAGQGLVSCVFRRLKSIL